MTGRNPHLGKLPKAPLQEVIFELYWDQKTGQTGQLEDPGFDLALGVFAEKIEKEFPIHKKTTPSVSSLASHQFWKGENTWPVVQIGPGMLVINDTDKNYEWEKTFSPLIETGIRNLIESYKNTPSFNSIGLHYIDVIPIPEKYLNGNVNEFISESFKFSLNNNFDSIGKLQRVNYQQFFTLEDNSQIEITILSGIDAQRRQVIILHTHIFKIGRQELHDMLSWKDYAHTVTSNLFLEIVTEKLYATFN